MPRKSTRSAQGSGTIRQRKDGRWEARYTAGRDPGTGKQIQKSIYGATQAEVLKKLQRISADISDGVYTEPSKLTVGAWLDIWLDEYTSDLKPRTLAIYKGHVEHRIKPTLGAVKLSALMPATIQAFYNNMLKDLSPKTIKNIHGVLHKALEQAIEIGYMKVNPSNACKLPRVDKTPIKPMESEDLNRFLQAIQGHQHERLFLVDLFTGLRQGELLGLTWDCVDFQKGTIFVYRQLQLLKGEYMFTSLKNDKARKLSPAEFVMRTLQEQRRQQAEWRMRAGSAWRGEGFVFTNELGEHLKRQTIYKQFKRVVEQIGIPHVRFHDMRHTYAVSALQSGDDVKTVQETLGHHTAAFTLDVYGHVTEQMKKESAARMDNFIKGIKKL